MLVINRLCGPVIHAYRWRSNHGAATDQERTLIGDGRQAGDHGQSRDAAETQQPAWLVVEHLLTT